MRDGGSGSGGGFVPVHEYNKNSPPSYVAYRVKAHEISGQCIAFSPKGNKLVSAGGEGIVKLWGMSLSESDMKQCRVANSPISSLIFNQNGSTLAAADTNSQINIIKVKPSM